MPLWTYTNPPAWPPRTPVKTESGWTDPLTGEVYVAIGGLPEKGGYSPVSITTASPITAGTNGSAYTKSLAALGGTGSYTWSKISGALPAGVSLSSLGVVSGTPTTFGKFSFTAEVVDAHGDGTSKSFALTINAAALVISTTTIPNGDVSTPYTTTFVATGNGGYVWTKSAGTLPAGLTLSSVGVLSGTPTTAADSSFTVHVTDASGASATQAITVTINAALTITTTTLPDGDATGSTAYSENLIATGGSGTNTWTVTVGTLPDGLTLAGNTISGTPTVINTFNFTVQVADTLGASRIQALSIVVT